MIVINPSDIIDNPNLNLFNKNTYGSVKTNLHTVYPESDDKADISLSLDFTSLFGTSGFSHDLITLNKLRQFDVGIKNGNVTNSNKETIGTLTDIGTFISGEEVVNYISSLYDYFDPSDRHTYRGVVYKKLKITLKKEQISSLAINSVQVNGTFNKATYRWEKGAVPKKFQEMFESKKWHSDSKTAIDIFMDLQKLNVNTTKSESLYNLSNSFSVTESMEDFIIEVDVPIQLIEAVYDFHYYFVYWYKSVDASTKTASKIDINFYSTAISDIKNEQATTVVGDKELNTFTFPDSELTQIGATTNGKDLFVENASSVLTNYINGRQSAILRCKITEYADERGYIQKNPVYGDVFEFGDIVSLYVESKGQKVPLSTYSDGSARMFKVLNSDVVYNSGKIYNEISIIETIPYLLNIYVPDVAVYRNGVQISNADYIYEGDSLTVYTSSTPVIVKNTYIPQNSSQTFFVTGNIYVDDDSGLFDENNNLIYSWAELQSLNFLSVNNNNLISYSCPTTGRLKISNKIDTISANAFEYNENLKGVEFPSALKSIGDSAFYYCSGLTSLVIPDTVTNIGNYAFLGCTGLAGRLTIPNSVISIGDGVFTNCSGITSVTFSNSLTSVPYQAFRGCSGLTGLLIIPDNITVIDAGAFYGCSSLTQVNFPKYLSEIKNWAFYDCTGVTSYGALGWTTVPTLGISVFENINSNCKIYVNDVYPEIKSYPNWSEYSNYIVNPFSVGT